MRVTNKLTVDSIISNLLRNKERLHSAQNIVSSQKKVNKPSDDPIGMAHILGYRKTLSAIDQYGKNIIRGKTHIELTESTLSTIHELLQEVRRLAVDQATGNLDNRPTIAAELKNIYDQILQLTNTQLGNSYIFSGHRTDVAPFSRDAGYNATYHGDDGDIRIIVGEKVDVKINVNGEEAFRSVVNVFDVLRDLINGLENPDTTMGTTQIAAQISPLTDSLTQIQSVRAAAASTFTRLETTENQLADFKLKVEQLLSDAEDADIASAIVELQTQETAYQISLATAARIIQSSLLDFLR
jgi:flagellar hook-associated protein 3 FlgL